MYLPRLNMLRFVAAILKMNMFGKEKGPRERNSLVWRGKIIGMHQSGQSISAISENLGIHRTTVARWIKRDEEDGDLSTRIKNGRPKLTTAVQRQQIVQHSRTNPKKTCVELHREFMPPVGVRCVRRLLHANGLRHRVPASKEELTANNVNERLMFAGMHE